MNDINALLNNIKTTLIAIPGVRAIVLGGSRARGTHSPDSDVDIGVYYDAEALDLCALRAAAQSVDDAHRDDLIAPPGQWGHWVNGGGWLTVDGCAVDFLLRDAQRVAAVIDECCRGIVAPHYQVGHPHAYISAMYMGELAVCKMLDDRDGFITGLKQIAEVYPPKLKEALIGAFGFEASFSLELAEKNVARGDTYYVAAHILRAVSSLNQVLFAVNEQYCLNEKRAVAMIDGFPIHPANYADRVRRVVSALGGDDAGACALLRELVRSTLPSS